MSTASLDSLTPREREILALIAKGDSLPEIAQQLHRSLKTIESHRLSLGRKLRASNRVELARIAIAAGLAPVRLSMVDPAEAQAGLAKLELGWLQVINEAVQNTTATDFIERFCQAASQLPGVEIAAICTPDPHRPEGRDPYHRYAIAVSERGHANAPMRYHAINTPCQTIIEEGQCCFSQGITSAYPNDAWLNELSAESYVGIQLTGENDKVVGGVGLIGRTPLENVDAYRRVLEFFAPHVARALAASLELEMLRSQCDQLEAERVDKDHALISASVDTESTPTALALAQMMRRLHPLAGAQFLRGVVDALCETFGMRCAGICALDQPHASHQLSSVTFRLDDQQADPICYNSKNTPCELVLRDGYLSLIDGAADAYPSDQFLVKNQIQGFAGIRLPSPTGEVAGILWVVDAKPLGDPDTIKHVLRHFATRIGAELCNFIRYESLLEEREWLEGELKRKGPESMQKA